MHSFTLKTSVVRQMGPVIDENCYYVDVEYTIYPLKYVKTYACLDEAVYMYRFGTSTQSMHLSNLIKNRNQHLKVAKSVATFYRDNQGELFANVDQMIAERISEIIDAQYKIYACMSLREARGEIKDFNRWLSDYPNFYTGLFKSRFINFACLNRIYDFLLWHVVARMYKIYRTFRQKSFATDDSN